MKKISSSLRSLILMSIELKFSASWIKSVASWLKGRLQTWRYWALLFFSVFLILALFITFLGTGIYGYSYACRDCSNLLFVSQTQQAQSDHVHTCQALFAFRIWWPHPNSLSGTSVPMQTPKQRTSAQLITSGQNHVGHHFNNLRVQSIPVLNLQRNLICVVCSALTDGEVGSGRKTSAPLFAYQKDSPNLTSHTLQVQQSFHWARRQWTWRDPTAIALRRRVGSLMCYGKAYFINRV